MLLHYRMNDTYHYLRQEAKCPFLSEKSREAIRKRSHLQFKVVAQYR